MQIKRKGPVKLISPTGKGVLRPDGTALAERWAATWTVGELEVELEMGADDQGRPICRELRARAEDGPSVTSSALRQIPVGRLVSETAALPLVHMSAERLPGGGWKLGPPSPEDRKRLRAPRRSRSRGTGDMLSQVADLYRQAVRDSYAPTEWVARELVVSRATASRWIRQARDGGFLGKAMRGRAGEETGE